MDPVESVIREAGQLRRRLWAASTTWSARLDHLFSTLLSGDSDIEALDKEAAHNVGIGHGFAVIFLLSGVTGMPHVKGQPAEEWVATWKETHPGSWHDQVKKLNADTKSLPTSYGSDIAGPVYATAMKRVHNRREDADDLVSDVYAKFLGHPYVKDVGYKQAIAYVQTSINNLGKNVGEEQNREQSLTPQDKEDKAVQKDVEDSTNIDQLMNERNARMIVEKIYTDPKIKHELESIHPDALLYLSLHAQDFDDVEILGVNADREILHDSKLKHPFITEGPGKGERMYPGNWNNQKKRMFAIIKKHFKHGGEHEHEKHASYDYDRRRASV